MTRSNFVGNLNSSNNFLANHLISNAIEIHIFNALKPLTTGLVYRTGALQRMSQQLRVGINGFGRIGRLFTRAAVQRDMFLPEVINDTMLDADSMAYLLRYDSVHGTAPFDIQVANHQEIQINGKSIKIYAEKDATKIPWSQHGVEVVAETSGAYTSYDKAEAHLEGHNAHGAKRVIISAPAKNTPVFVMGVNHELYDPNMKIISNASCTTNCLAPLAKVVNDLYGIEEGLLTTVHAMTATQALVDGPSKKDYRAGRSAGRNIIPASTGAAKAVTQVLPELEGKMTGMAFRVPVENVSVVDFTCRLTQPMQSLDDLGRAIDQIEKDPTHPLHGILGVTRDPVVSIDFNGDDRSCIFDLTASILLNPRFVKLIAYYDNEWAYAVRLVS